MTQDLEQVRLAIDRVDKTLQKALMTRARLVRAAIPLKGKGMPVRFAREAQMLRTLVARYQSDTQGDTQGDTHGDTLAFGEFFALWREILMAMVRLQDPKFRVAVCKAQKTLAAQQFTSRHLLTVPSPTAALEALKQKKVALAVLPFPKGKTHTWWAELKGGFSVLGLLPCIKNLETGHALVVGCMPFESSGDDVSFFVLPKKESFYEGGRVVGWTEQKMLVSVAGHWEGGVGGYPMPVTLPKL